MNNPIGRDDPENWFWGVFYYNSADKQLFVPKRYGLGWTFNFANPWSWCLLLILLVSIAYSFLFVK